MDNNYQKFLAQIKRHEGTVKNRNGLHEAYLCPAGCWTIGYGHNIDADPKVVIFEPKTDRPETLILNKHSTIEDWEADAILDYDIKRFETDLTRYVPYTCGLKIDDPVRYYAMLNMVFNMGIHRFLGFKKTIMHVSNSNFIKAADEMIDSSWAYQVGPRARELSSQMKTGRWQF